MDDRRTEFFRNVIIDEKDINRANQFLDSKGIEKHIILKEKLFNWVEGEESARGVLSCAWGGRGR